MAEKSVNLKTDQQKSRNLKIREKKTLQKNEVLQICGTKNIAKCLTYTNFQKEERVTVAEERIISEIQLKLDEKHHKAQ